MQKQEEKILDSAVESSNVIKEILQSSIDNSQTIQTEMTETNKTLIKAKNRVVNLTKS